jgi:Rod binding domain-containing protein
LKTNLNTLSNLLQGSKKPKGINVRDRNKQVSNNSQYIPDPYKKVASSMEQQFANFMLTEMQKTAGEESGNDTGTDYYKSLLQTERAKTMSAKGDGLGLKKMILEQIYPQRLRNEITYNNFKAREQSQFKKSQIDMHEKQQRFSELNKLSASVNTEKGMGYE